MSSALIHEVANAAARAADQPALSVLIPFYRDDPAPLLAALEAQGGDIEIVLFDDGRPDSQLNASLEARVQDADVPARLLTARANLGRAAGRNALARRARGDWLLFLDADMEIHPGFIARWLEIARNADFEAAFGGFEMPETIAREHALHAALARAGDVESAEARQARGPSAFASSNLLVSWALMAETGFDESYTGWGWEDVDWAVRAAASARLVHVDNPARHGGLQTTETLLAKFEAGGANFARFLAAHPQMEALPGAKAARLVQRSGLGAPVRRVCAAAAKAAFLPMRARVLALKFHKAACAAEALS